MTELEQPTDPWENDLLDYKSLGHSYENLIKSIDDSKVISIEAGFGRGKTFFRKAWAEQLKQSGEVVVEIDAQVSDHSGDPVVTFIGALVAALPETGKTQKAVDTVKRYSGIVARSAARIALRHGADEVIDMFSERAEDIVEDNETLKSVVGEMGKGLSKAAEAMISVQLAAEKVRQKEMPEQLTALQSALVEGKAAERVVIIIDELDRCHPDYAIALLEAMKLVFDHPGFVFVLMVNANYLENLAQHRFGSAAEGERYLDKFVDIRLSLPLSDQSLKIAVIEKALRLPLEIPFGDGDEFTVRAASVVAGEMAIESNLSMRQIEKVLLKVELALRCYRNEPLDLPLLLYLAFNQAVLQLPVEHRGGAYEALANGKHLPRARLEPQRARELADKVEGNKRSEGRDRYLAETFISENCPELVRLPIERYQLPDQRNYYDWAKVLIYLAPRYIPEHQSVLDSVRAFQAEDPE
jgi:hypothetical protein